MIVYLVRDLGEKDKTVEYILTEEGLPFTYEYEIYLVQIKSMLNFEVWLGLEELKELLL